MTVRDAGIMLQQKWSYMANLVLFPPAFDEDDETAEKSKKNEL